MESAEFNNKLSQRTSTVEELKKELVARDSCIKALMNENNARGMSHFQGIDELEKELEMQKEMVQALEKESEKASEFEEKCEKLKEELDSLRSEQLNTTSSSEAAATEVRKMEFQMESAVSDLNSQTAQLEAELEKKNSELEELKSEMESLRESLKNAVDINMTRAHEAGLLQRRLIELEKQIDENKNAPPPLQELHNELREKESVQSELVSQIDIVMKERSEAIDALEQMIHEVQIRQDELDELNDMLENREEELEHAKLIATKALASAQEIKTRYKNKGYDMQAGYKSKVEELTASVDYLTSKNDKLRKQQSRLESELREKNREVVRLRDQMRDQTFLPRGTFASSQSDGFLPMKDTVNGFISLDSQMESTDKQKKRGKMNEFMLLENGFAGSSFHMDQQSMSSGSSQDLINDTMSTKTAELGEATKWLQDVESNSDVSSTHEIKSEPGTGRTNSRSAERDQLRKYVRKRYIKRQQAAAGKN
mmetsp:Transcript_30634/g.43475  ORF Transcript_30634/g.43475 Transcript_30634/m.43475 type:complete len:484 (+) Transcript_30634:113-1564(+)